jgi:hypothetical protein
MKTIVIPMPCKQKTEEMTPVPSGRFCGLCNKTVVDFTDKTECEIQRYFMHNAGQKTCGMFWERQLAPREKRSFNQIRFAAALLLIFGASLFQACNESPPRRVIGDSIMVPDDVLEQRALRAADSIRIADSIAALNHKHDSVKEKE